MSPDTSLGITCIFTSIDLQSEISALQKETARKSMVWSAVDNRL